MAQTLAVRSLRRIELNHDYQALRCAQCGAVLTCFGDVALATDGSTVCNDDVSCLQRLQSLMAHDDSFGRIGYDEYASYDCDDDKFDSTAEILAGLSDSGDINE